MPRLTAPSACVVDVVSSAAPASASSVGPMTIVRDRRPPTERVAERRRLGRDADHVEHRHRTRRGGRRSQRLELVLRSVIDAVDDRDRGPDQPSDEVPERGEERVAHADGVRHGRGPRSGPWRRRPSSRVQPELGHVAGDRGADVDEVAVALGARAEHAVGEDDGVRLRPGDLLAEGRPVARAGRARRSTSPGSPWPT